MRVHGIVVVFTSLSPLLESLLRNHGVLREEEEEDGDDDNEDESEGNERDKKGTLHKKAIQSLPRPLCLTIPRLDDALEWCEDQILASERSRLRLQPMHGYHHHHLQEGRKLKSLSSSSEPESPTWPLRLILEDYLELEATNGASERAAAGSLTGGSVSNVSSGSSPLGSRKLRESAMVLGREEARALLDADVLGLYFRREEYSPGHIIFDVGDIADKVSMV